MKTLTSIGIQKIGQRFVDSVDHADYTLNGVPQTAEPFRRFVQGASARVYIYFDDKVLVTPTWKIEGAVAKVEACNNGFDAVPTWEDITAMVQINRVYNFTNKTKTASKWGVNIRFTITKNEGFEGEVSISGFGGAYE